MAPLYLSRETPKSFPPARRLLAGAAEVDVTPPIGAALAGYSTMGKTARGACGHLFARALFLDGEASERVALVFLDLHSATRYLLERAASVLAPTVGLGPDRLVLAGTRTHSGPGWTYGNSFYDGFTRTSARSTRRSRTGSRSGSRTP